MSIEAFVVIILLISLAIAMPWIVRSVLWNRAMRALQNNQVQKAEEIFTSKAFELFFGKFSREWNLLKLALGQGKKQEIERQTRRIIDGDFSRNQRVTAAKATYFYFLDQENQEMCKDLLTVIQESRDRKEVKQNEMLYRVLIEKKHEDIEYVESLLEEETKKKETDPVQIGILQYILGVQYISIQNTKKADALLRKARQNLKHTPYSKKIKALLSA